MVDAGTYIVALAILLIIYFIFGIFIIINAIDIYSKKRKFNKTLFEGLKNGAVEELDDVINLYANIRHLNPEDIRHRYGLGKWLREFWVLLISKEDKSIEDNKIRDLKLKIDDFIRQVEKSSPFSDVPDKERGILTDIITFSEKNNKEAIQNKVSELAGIIQTKNDSFNKIDKMNKLSIPLAIFGVILTIAFGILSLR